jgi:group I intron endonuclease
MLLILEDLGKIGSVTKDYMLTREQYYLDIIFKNYSTIILNNCSIAGTTLGIKHKPEFIKNRLGSLNPMSGKQLSPEFLYMQTRNKVGKNNPNYGGKKSSITLSKIIKLVYVYNSEDRKYIGSKPTVLCSKTFKIGKDTLTKYIKLGLPFKGKIYSRNKLH